jgi:hypothetical protein
MLEPAHLSRKYSNLCDYILMYMKGYVHQMCIGRFEQVGLYIIHLDGYCSYTTSAKPNR